MQTSPQDDERQRLMAQLQVVWRFKQGYENRSSVVSSTVTAYEAILDTLIADVAVDLHRTLSLGLDTLDSVQPRVPPSDAASPAWGPYGGAGGSMDMSGAAAGSAITVKTPAGKVGKGTKDIYGRTGGASKEATACPNCLQKVAAARFAQHLERCLGKGRAAARNSMANRQHLGLGAMGAMGVLGSPPRMVPAVKPRKQKAKSLAALAAEGPAIAVARADMSGAGSDDDMPLSAMLAHAGTTPTPARGKKKAAAASAAAAAAAAGAETGTGGMIRKGGVVRKPRSGLVSAKKAAAAAGVGVPGAVDPLTGEAASRAKAAKVTKAGSAKGKRGKKAAEAQESAAVGSLLENPFASRMDIPFDDSTFNATGGFDGFGDDTSGDLNVFDFNFDFGPEDPATGGVAAGIGGAFGRATDPMPKPTKKKRTPAGTGTGRRGRGGRGRGAAVSATVEGQQFPAMESFDDMLSGLDTLDGLEIPMGIAGGGVDHMSAGGMMMPAHVPTGGRGGRGRGAGGGAGGTGRGRGRGGRGTTGVTAAGVHKRGKATKGKESAAAARVAAAAAATRAAPGSGGKAKKTPGAKAGKGAKKAKNVSLQPQDVVGGQNTLASAFDSMFGTGEGLEMPGEAFGGMADNDLQVLFDGDDGGVEVGNADADALDFGDLFG